MAINSIDFPNLSNPFTQIDAYVAPGASGSWGYAYGAQNQPGSAYQIPPAIFSQYTNWLYAPAITILGTTATSKNVTAVNINTSALSVGMAVIGSGVAAGTTIAAIPSSTTLTLSLATTSSVTLDQLTCFYPTPASSNGFAPILKYVRYQSTNNPALNAYPSAVYYADGTGALVTGYANEAYGVTANNAALNPNACAGVLLPNSTSLGISGSASATALNGNWCWIQVGGLCPGVTAVASSVIGDTLSASVTTTQSFTVVRTALGTANPYSRYLGTVWSNLSTNTTADILINPILALS